MIRFALVLGLIFLAFDASSQRANSPANIVTDVSVTEFKHLMDSLEGEVVVDLRTPEELQQQGKIAGSLEIDYFGANYETGIEALDTGKVYLLYCASGGRSGETAELMKNMGFKKIYNLKEGFRGWTKQKMPVTRK